MAAASVLRMRLRIPSLGVDAAVVPVDIGADGGLGVPADPQTLGWWAAGAAPGNPSGTVVIDGHVDTRADGAGALFHLADLPVNAVVALQSGTSTFVYTVRVVRSYAKAALPPETFNPQGPPRLVLITCGGTFNLRTRQYSDNVVAYETPT